MRVRAGVGGGRGEKLGGGEGVLARRSFQRLAIQRSGCTVQFYLQHKVSLNNDGDTVVHGDG